MALQKLLKIVLYSRVATEKELKGDIKLPKKTNLYVKELIKTDSGKIWNQVNEFSDDLVEENPIMALDLAVNLWNLNTSAGTEQDKVNEFLKTTALSILGNDGLKSYLANFFEGSEKGESLAKDLVDLITTNISEFNTPEAFTNPLGYSVLSAIYIGLGLKDQNNSMANVVYESAKERVLCDDVKQAFDIEIKNFEDCNYMKERYNEAYKNQ